MNENDRKPFLPSRTEIKMIGGGLLVVVAHMAFMLSCLLPLSLLWLVPAGDRFPHVASRLCVVLLSVIAGDWMLKRKAAIFRHLFGSIVSNESLDAYSPPAKPAATSMKVAIQRDWELGVVAVVMLTVVCGAVDFDVPWAVEKNWGKYLWIAQLLEWLRANPNTTKSVAWLIAVGSLLLYGLRIQHGWLCQTQISKNEEVRQCEQTTSQAKNPFQEMP